LAKDSKSIALHFFAENMKTCFESRMPGLLKKASFLTATEKIYLLFQKNKRCYMINISLPFLLLGLFPAGGIMEASMLYFFRFFA
jgi:hypothetical protein